MIRGEACLRSLPRLDVSVTLGLVVNGDPDGALDGPHLGGQLPGPGIALPVGHGSPRVGALKLIQGTRVLATSAFAVLTAEVMLCPQ